MSELAREPSALRIAADELTALLPGWLVRQRWFADKGRPVRQVRVLRSTPLLDGEPAADLLLLAVAFVDGPEQRYQLVLGRRRASVGELEHAVLGAVGDEVVYDGVWDHEVTDALLDALREGRTAGEVRFGAEPGAEIPVGVPGRVLGVEQSNTSVVYGEDCILKLFRRPADGVNPDLELHRALRVAGSTQVAGLRGAIETEVDGHPVTLGMLQDFAANSADGWSMALASVRDLFAEGDLHADEVGGDFAGEAARLGETVAIVHAELAATLGGGTADPGEVAAVMAGRFEAATAVVPGLAEQADAVRRAFGELAELGTGLPVQRVHGDLHLGQTLRTPRSWLLIDFEGEPAAPVAERVRPDSPLRDVAGMVRSFDYAARHEVAQWQAELEHESQLAWRAREWSTRNREAFCAGYAQHAGADPRAHAAVLRAYELDKAVYEAVYETRSRPAWVAIPLGAIARLTADPAG